MHGIAWKFECPKCKKKIVAYIKPHSVTCSRCNKTVNGIETTIKEAERWLSHSGRGLEYV